MGKVKEGINGFLEKQDTGQARGMEVEYFELGREGSPEQRNHNGDSHVRYEHFSSSQNLVLGDQFTHN